MNDEPMAMKWPTESRGFCDFHENVIVIYGIPKIGKTTFASNMPDSGFILTEKGAKHVKVKGWDINTWGQFLNTISQLEQNIQSCPFKNIVIDTVDNLSDMCTDFICKKYGVSDLLDVPYGKAFASYTREFKKQINRILKLGLSLTCISHAEEKDVNVNSIISPYAHFEADIKTGMVHMTVPTMEKRSRKFLLGIADIIMYMELDADLKRVIRTNPSKHFEAGDRSGRLPSTLPLDYEAVVSAYYGSLDGIKERIGKAEEYMKSIGLPYDVMEGDENNYTNLETYLQYLKMLAKNNLKQKGGK